MIELSEKYRLRAAACEKLAREETDPRIKLAWADIAIEWHALAFRVIQHEELEIE
jgi:hypothetical protein